MLHPRSRRVSTHTHALPPTPPLVVVVAVLLLLLLLLRILLPLLLLLRILLLIRILLLLLLLRILLLLQRTRYCLPTYLPTYLPTSAHVPRTYTESLLAPPLPSPMHTYLANISTPARAEPRPRDLECV